MSHFFSTPKSTFYVNLITFKKTIWTPSVQSETVCVDTKYKTYQQFFTSKVRKFEGEWRRNCRGEDKDELNQITLYADTTVK